LNIEIDAELETAATSQAVYEPPGSHVYQPHNSSKLPVPISKGEESSNENIPRAISEVKSDITLNDRPTSREPPKKRRKRVVHSEKFDFTTANSPLHSAQTSSDEVQKGWHPYLQAPKDCENGIKKQTPNKNQSRSMTFSANK
jgi:hypothetical protein